MSKLEELNKAIKLKNKDKIIKALQLHKNPQTMISYFYKFKGGMDDDTRDEIFNELIRDHLKVRKQQSVERETSNINLSFNDIKELMENKNKTDIDLLIYQLLNTGRRLQEIVSPEIEIKDGELWIKLSKEKKWFKVRLLDGNIKRTYEDIQKLKGKFNNNSISTQIARKLKNKGLTAHRLRDIYVMLIHKFNNPKNLILDNIANQYLGHNSNSSDRYYTRIIYGEGDPFNNKYDKMTVKELKALCKERGLKKYSKLRKIELIKMLN